MRSYFSSLFKLGQIYVTPGTLEICPEHRLRCLTRHAAGDWGSISPADATENTRSITEGFRILSAYPIDPAKPCKGFGDNCFWIVTEADRSVTTFLLPSEY